jgi:hypothetical protein
MTQPTMPIPPTHAEALAVLCEAVVPLWSRQLQTAQTQAEEGVTGMLQRFSMLRKMLLSADTAVACSSEINEVIDEILMGFQYHDRTAQMLALVQADMERLTQALPPSTSPVELEPTQWLARLADGYAMAEQRINHAVDDFSDPASPQPSASETTYF